MALVKAVEDLAAQKGCTPGQLALAWVLARGDDVIPIPGTKRPNCFDENLAALKVKLTPEECTELENAVPQHEVRLSALPQKVLPVAYVCLCSPIVFTRPLCLLMRASQGECWLSTNCSDARADAKGVAGPRQCCDSQ